MRLLADRATQRDGTRREVTEHGLRLRTPIRLAGSLALRDDPPIEAAMSEVAELHLAVDLSFTHTDSRWRLPGAWANRAFPDLKMFEEFARIAERGMLDLLFFGDGTGIPDTFEGSLDGAVRWGVQWPRQDMSPYIAALAQVTDHIGFGLTYSSTFMQPFYVARLLNSLDHVTGGRIAFNVIASSRLADAANYGFEALMDHDRRYERMEEFVDLCLDLWASVEPDAIAPDTASGVFADPAKVHQLHHHGTHFSVRGPLNAVPSPQGRPLLVQAGASPRGIAASAHFADLVFAMSGSLEHHVHHRAALDEALRTEGRDPDSVGVLWSMPVLIAESSAEAKARKDQLLGVLPAEAIGVYLSHNCGYDFSRLGSRVVLEELQAEIVAANASPVGFVHQLIKERGGDATMSRDDLFAEAARHISGYDSVVAGTAAEIADLLEEIFVATGERGGFMLSSPGAMPPMLAAISDLLVPELQRRGRFRRRYHGDTLAENLLGHNLRPSVSSRTAVAGP
jgi:FMN-dependent oxidoreductase (nitrilotriacetate monooxygenase family)